VIDRYALVLAAVAGTAADQVVLQRPASVLARLSGARSGVLYDGMSDPAMAKRVMDMMRRGGAISMRSGTVRVTFSDPANGFPADESALRIQIPMVEQSNSSVLIGDKYLLKVFRRLQTGENPDIEVGRTLAGRANEARVPALLAWAEYQAPGAPPTSIAMVQQQVASRGSAWQRALDEVRNYAERAMVAHRARADRGDRGLLTSAEIEDRIGVYRATIELLGRRTADLHRTMAGIDREGFGVQPYARADLDKLVGDLKAHAARALEMARDRRATLQPATSERVDALLAQAPSVDAILERLLSIDDAGKRIRTHGDFHLGQVLEVDGDVFFIDFEGEPARPIAERRLPQSPLRDVAGMLRSFGYAARAGFKTVLEDNPESAPILQPWITGWELHASAAYVSAYLKSIEDSGLLPTSTNRDLLLRAFLLDKALYELSYELNNRPAWVDIPVDGLLRLLQPAEG
jgi:trehalose synthase-fused probable maltokinase